MTENAIEHFMGKVRDSAVRFFSRIGIRPNLLTLIGLILSSVTAIAFSLDKLRMAGAMLIIAGAFDMLDGQVARGAGQVTRFGAFIDSVVDRYSDSVIFLGVMVNYLNQGREAYALLTLIAMVGALITSYSKARGEDVIESCKVGYLQRPERVVLLIIGGLSRRMDPVVWIIAVLSHLTVLQRIFFVFTRTAGEESSIKEEGEFSITNEEHLPPVERPIRGARAFDLVRWDYQRNSWQFYLMSAIILIVIFMPDLLKIR